MSLSPQEIGGSGSSTVTQKTGGSDMTKDSLMEKKCANDVSTSFKNVVR